MSKPAFVIGIKKTVSASIDDNSIELAFYDVIQDPEYFDWNTMQMETGNLVSEVISYVQAFSPSKINMKIDSMGGSLPIAISLYNFLKDYPAKIECKIVGFCASAATVLAMAASKGKLIMPKNGYFITHQASGWDICGKANEIREQADFVESLTNTMADILASRNTTGKSKADILALWTNGDNWMDGEAAKTFGFVDDFYNETVAVVTARIDEAKILFKNAPNITAEVPEEKTHESFFTKISKEMKDLKSLVTAAIDGIKSSKVNSKADNISAEIAEAIAQPLSDMVDAMQAEVTAEITTAREAITAEVTTAVTAAMETKYSASITGFETKVSELTAELEKQTGRASVAADTSTAPAKARLTVTPRDY